MHHIVSTDLLKVLTYWAHKRKQGGDVSLLVILKFRRFDALALTPRSAQRSERIAHSSGPFVVKRPSVTRIMAACVANLGGIARHQAVTARGASSRTAGGLLPLRRAGASGRAARRVRSSVAVRASLTGAEFPSFVQVQGAVANVHASFIGSDAVASLFQVADAAELAAPDELKGLQKGGWLGPITDLLESILKVRSHSHSREASSRHQWRCLGRSTIFPIPRCPNPKPPTSWRCKSPICRLPPRPSLTSAPNPSHVLIDQNRRSTAASWASASRTPTATPSSRSPYSSRLSPFP